MPVLRKDGEPQMNTTCRNDRPACGDLSRNTWSSRAGSMSSGGTRWPSLCQAAGPRRLRGKRAERTGAWPNLTAQIMTGV